jgi:hypothetical protein
MSILTTMKSHDGEKNDTTCTTSISSSNKAQRRVSFKNDDDLIKIHTVVNLKRSLTRKERKLIWTDSDPSRREIKKMLKEQEQELYDEKECNSNDSSSSDTSSTSTSLNAVVEDLSCKNSSSPIKTSRQKRLRRLHFSWFQLNKD